ncbi:MAG: hisD, partial [Acidobacteria bacterium]|nr:hisD [Acidobacteriota bacterium]
LRAHGGIIVTSSAAEAMELANAAAPEHLVVDDDRLARMVRCAGSVFVGPWSAQVAGDYAIGCNHVLPTAGAARARGGLSAADFVRQITIQRLTQAGLRRIGNTVMTLAAAEGLHAHAASIEVRTKESGARRQEAGVRGKGEGERGKRKGSE